MTWLKEFVDWDEGLDWEKAKPGAISSEWVSDASFFSTDYPKKKFIDHLSRQKLLFRVLRRILERKYRSIQNRAYAIDNPNLKDNLLFYEGYKQALKDIHKILPRPEGE